MAPLGQGARAALAERDRGAARHVHSFRRQFKKKGAVGFGHRRAKGLGRRLQSATGGADRYVHSFRRQFKKKGGVGSGYCRARSSGGACRARLRGGSPCPLSSPPVQEEVRRRLSGPPGQRLGRRLQSATRGRLAMSTRFAASSRRRAASALGTAEPKGSDGACRARLGGRLEMSTRFAASLRKSAALPLGTAGPTARAALAKRD